MATGSYKSVIHKILLSRWKFLILFFVYLVFRIPIILFYPIFNDEALTIRYARLMMDETNRFYTLAVGGKPPLLFWIDGVIGILTDPLVGARSISFLCGIGTLVLLYQIGKKMWSKNVGILACLIYILSPISIFYDSLAIHDSYITLTYAAMLYLLQITVSSKQELLRGLALGLVIAGGLWVKPTAVLFIGIIFCIYIWKMIKKEVSFVSGLLGFVACMNTIILLMLPLLLRPEFSGAVAMQSEYSQSPAAILTFPIMRWVNNIQSAGFVYVGYISPFVVLVCLWGVCANFWKQNEKVFLYLLFSITLFLLAIFANGLHSRYVLFSTIPLYLLASEYFSRHNRILYVVLCWHICFSTILVYSPARFFTLFPNYDAWTTDSFQYVRGWPSGYGVMDALRAADKDRAGKSAFIGVRWDAGNPEDTILMYASRLPGVTTTFVDKRLPTYPRIFTDFANKPIYLITRENQRGDLDGRVSLVERYQKPYGGESVELYKYIP